MYEAINLTSFPVVQFADSDGRRPGEICLCLKSRLRLVDGSVPIEDPELEQPEPSIGTSNADFGNSLIHDSDFVFPKPVVDVVLEADYQPKAEDQDAGVATVGFEITVPSGDGKEKLLLRKSVDVHPERWWKMEADEADPQKRRVQLIRGGFTPFHLRAELGHGGTSSRYNRKGIGYDPYAPSGAVPLCRLMPPGVERYRWDEDRSATGFTAIDPSDLARLRFYGTMDAQWQKYRSPGLPDDFDPRYYNFAPVDQQLAHAFRGSEIFRFQGFGAAPRRFSFTFPSHRLQCYAKLSRMPEAGQRGATPRPETRVSLYRFEADTILVDLTNRHVDISWRTVLPTIDPAAWRVLLVIFDDTKQAEADAVIRDQEAVGGTLSEQALIDNLMSIPELSAALGGRPPGSLAEMNTLMMQLLQTQMSDVVGQMQGLSGITGRPFPSVTQIQEAVKSGGDVRAIATRLGMGDLL